MKITGLRVGYNFIYPTYWRLESLNNGPMEDWKINLNSRYFFVAKKNFPAAPQRHGNFSPLFRGLAEWAQAGPGPCNFSPPNAQRVLGPTGLGAWRRRGVFFRGP
jgi:hypothetical protein